MEQSHTRVSVVSSKPIELEIEGWQEQQQEQELGVLWSQSKRSKLLRNRKAEDRATYVPSDIPTLRYFHESTCEEQGRTCKGQA
jgi:hypothetical protein